MQDLVGPALGTLALAAAGGYLLGSIPFGVILTRAAGAGDVRNIGSGNIGATNVLRTGRKDLAIATLLLDAGKGAAALLLARYFFPGVPAVAAVAGGAAFLGHLFPVWLGFKGGKGVATTLGVCLALGWALGLAYAAVWLIVMAATRISSLGGMSAAVAAPIAAAATGRETLVPVLVGIALIVLYLHRENIARLRAGAEPKVGGKKA